MTYPTRFAPESFVRPQGFPPPPPWFPGWWSPYPPPADSPTRGLTRTPLSPDDFPTPDEEAGAQTGGGLDLGSDQLLSESDKVTLQRALDLLKELRADAVREPRKAGDDDDANVARRRLGMLVSYLLGFFDGKRLQSTAAVSTGFQTLFPVKQDRTLRALLDDLEQSLEELTAEETRKVSDVLKAVGAAFTAAGEIAAAFGF